MEKQDIYESKQGLKSMKLFNIIKQHGGFKEKTPSFYLHDMTDDDIIGEVDYSTLDLMRDMDPIDWSRWAMQKGYNVGRGDRVEILPLKDDTWIAVIERGSNLGNKDYLNSKIGKKLNDRYKNRLNRGDKNYQWSDTGKWGSPRAEEFYMRRTQNDIANQRRQRYGNGAVYKLSEHILTGLDKFATTSDIRRFTDSVIKKLYRVSQPYTSHRFRDNDWRSLRSFVNILREVYGVKELNLSGTGPYKQSQEGTYKEYTLDITTTLGSKISGFIRCHFCGSQENPWDVYDMTVNFYRDDENNNKINENNNEIKENNMAKIQINENELKQIVAESVKRVLEEGIMRGALRRAYNRGRYDDDKFNLDGYLGDIKGRENTDDDSVNFWKDAYKEAKAVEKERYGDKPNEKVGGKCGYSNWTNKACAQDIADSFAENGIQSIPGIKGKITRAAMAPLQMAANGAGKIAKKIRK